MAKYTATFTADAANTYVCTVNKKRDLTDWFATAFVTGTFGGGTVTLLISPDGGTTKVPLLNTSNVAISTGTAGAMSSIRLGGSGSTNSDSMIIYATLTGSTNPALTVAIFDNN